MAKNTKSSTNKSSSTVGIPNLSDENGNTSDTWQNDNKQAGGNSTDTTTSAGYYNFKIPNWGYRDFAEETDIFRKGLGSLTGEPGWFYFKIFFHFEDEYGLLGDVITNSKGKNTAYNYLAKRIDTYKYDNMEDRAIALSKFVKYLSFINCNAPWFFEKINGLGSVQVPLNEFSKEKTIEIGCNQDAIDMRLISLFHLYQYACFDEINMKEIIPRNLRKFNMSIVLFHMPIKYYDTGIYSKSKGEFKYKSLTGNSGTYGNRMSYKMFTFRGCEFDLESINNALFASEMNNEKPFALGHSSIKIKYDRVFTHLMNSWEQFMLGPDGYYYEADAGINANDANEFKNRISAIMLSINATQGNINNETYAELVDSTEHHLGHTFIKSGNVIGNINGINVNQFRYDVIKWNSIYGRPAPYRFQGNIYKGAVFRGGVLWDTSPYKALEEGNYWVEMVDFSTPYSISLANTVQSYKNMWNNIKNAASGAWSQVKSLGSWSTYKNALGF